MYLLSRSRAEKPYRTPLLARDHFIQFHAQSALARAHTAVLYLGLVFGLSKIRKGNKTTREFVPLVCVCVYIYIMHQQRQQDRFSLSLSTLAKSDPATDRLYRSLKGGYCVRPPGCNRSSDVNEWFWRGMNSLFVYNIHVYIYTSSIYWILIGVSVAVSVVKLKRSRSDLEFGFNVFPARISWKLNGSYLQVVLY